MHATHGALKERHQASSPSKFDIILELEDWDVLD